MNPAPNGTSSAKRERRILGAVALLGVLYVAAPWFGSSGYLFFTDFSWGPRQIVSWRHNGAPLLLLMSALGKVLSPAVVEKGAVTAILLLLAVSGMRLASVLTKDVRVRALVGLYVLFNPFVYERLGYGQMNLLAGFGFFVLGMAELLVAARGERDDRFVPWSALWFGLSLQFSPHFLFFIAAAAAACALPIWRARSWRPTTAAKAAASAALIVIALNANAAWQLHAGSADGVTAGFGHDDLMAFRTSGSSGKAALANVVMLSGFWGKDQMRFFDLTTMKESWGRSFFVLLPIILTGAVVAWRDKRRRALAAGFAVLAVAAVLLAVGVSMGGSRELTIWLFDHFPLYKGLRETQKWVAALLLAYAVFLAWGLEFVFSRAFVKSRAALVTGLLAAIVLMQAPAMAWGLSGAVRPHEYPAEWSKVDDLLADAGCRGKTLVLPWHMYVGMSWNGTVTANPSPSFFRCPVITGTNMEWGGIYDNSGNVTGAAVERWLAAKGDDPFLASGEADVRYLLLQKDVDWKSYDWLDALPGLRLVQEGDITKLYEVTSQK